MKIQFNNGGSKDKNYVGSLTEGNFESMMKQRKEYLPDIQASIQDALKDYSGEAICIIIQKEDENGLPSQSHLIMAGATRLESQVAMSKALSKASREAIQILMESAKGDVRAMLKIASALAGTLVSDEEEN